MKKVIILSGLPGSGKSTWAKAYCNKNKDWVRVNRDDLRNMRGQYWLPKQEDLITAWERSCVCYSLIQGYNVIIDATNLNKKYLNNLKENIKEEFNDVWFETKFFDVSPEECMKRDLQRENSVGDKIIWDMCNKYLKLKIKETQKTKQDINLKHVILVDLDGTIAIKGNRSPYDGTKVDQDTPNVPIVNIVKKYLNDPKIGVIFFTAREGTKICKTLTDKWLENIFGKEICYTLYMRKEGDHRKDSIIKKELYEKHIKDKYYVEFILDDRDQVINMWRNELGLTCLQVNYGDF